MRIRSNLIALQSWRSLMTADNEVEHSISRLSSGLRVVTAADDAAGLGMSNRIRGQYTGLSQASRNALDGISLVNVAEGALQEVHALLQRGYELSLQAANDTLTDSDKGYVQIELNHLLSEIDRISDATTFNGIYLLSPSANASAVSSTIAGLRSGWLEQAQNLIQTMYGLVGDSSTINVVLEQSGQKPAWITGTPGAGGKLNNLAIHINLADFGSFGGPDGGTGPVYNDRKTARVLTQALLARNANFASLSSWFISGASDYIAGRDEQVQADIAQYGAAAVVNALATPWIDDSIHESSAYVAMRYLDSLLAPFTVKDVMAELQGGSDLSSALSVTLGQDESWLLSEFQSNGLAFLNGLTLNGSDVGGIGGGTASTVIPNGGTYSLNPLSNFDVIWSSNVPSNPNPVVLQVGANEGDTMSVAMSTVSTFSLNLFGLDLVGNAAGALDQLTSAISQVSSFRTYLGATSNRLQHAITANDVNSEAQLSSFSHMIDLDFAQELTTLTRAQLLVASSSAITAHANTARQHILWLLKNLSTPDMIVAQSSSPAAGIQRLAEPPPS